MKNHRLPPRNIDEYIASFSPEFNQSWRRYDRRSEKRHPRRRRRLAIKSQPSL